MHRQRVEELVGDQQHRSLRHLVERGVPPDRLAREARALQAAQARAGLDQMQAQARAKSRHLRRRPQDIRHQGAAAGPELDQQAGVGPAEVRPGPGEPEPHELAEHLADLGRGDEVAGGAERIVPGVVAERRMGQRERHEARGRDRAGAPDLLDHHRFKSAQGPRAPAGRSSTPPARGPPPASAATAAGPW